MTAEDIDAILALEQAIQEAPHWSRASYELCVAMDATKTLRRAGFVANKDGAVLGFAIGKLVAEVCEIESIAVAGTLRGQGIGQTLMAAVMAWAVSRGATRLELEVRASNTSAIRLYERAGLRQEGLRARYYEDPEEDAVLMGKALDTVENFSEKRIASRPPGC